MDSPMCKNVFFKSSIDIHGLSMQDSYYQPHGPLDPSVASMRFLLQCAAAAALGARAAGQTLAATKAAWNYQQARHLQESESE